MEFLLFDIFDDITPTFAVVFILIVVYILMQIRKSTVYSLFTTIKSNKGHTWYIALPDVPVFCNICGTIMVPKQEDILQCYYCWSYSHRACITSISYRCKQYSSKLLSHLWIKGNLDPGTLCHECEEICSNFLSISNYRCAWCQKCYHDECLPKSTTCNGGELSRYLLSPTCVNVVQNNSRSTDQLLQERSSTTSDASDGSRVGDDNINPNTNSVHENNDGVSTSTYKGDSSHRNNNIDGHADDNDNLSPGSDNTTSYFNLRKKCSHLYEIKVDSALPSPLLLFLVNRKSGGLSAELLLPKICSYFHPLQICDIVNDDPKKFLQRYLHIKNIYIIICGGDGTVSWVLEIMDPMIFDFQPAVGVLPLGTGNDLANQLGCKIVIEKEDFIEVIKRYAHSTLISFDRWNFDLTSQNKSVHRKFTNYCGFGMDSIVAYEFHTYRNQLPKGSFSPLMNKIKYALFGVQRLFAKQYNDYLSDCMTVSCDGKDIDIKNYKNLVILNINSYAGGAKSFQDFNNSDHAVNDGYIEVIGLTDALHTGMMVTGISSPYYITKCKQAHIKINKPVPMQLDGEPWIQYQSEIEISLDKQIYLLQNQNDQQPLKDNLEDILLWGEINHVIDHDQHTKLKQRLIYQRSISKSD